MTDDLQGFTIQFDAEDFVLDEETEDQIATSSFGYVIVDEFGATSSFTSVTVEAVLDTTIFDDTNDPGNGVVAGTDGDDRISGGISADRGGAEPAEDVDDTFPDDTITGGDGDDEIFGGAGTDDLDGGPDADTLYGGADGDRIQGGLGEDFLYGEGGNDLLFGGIIAQVDGEDVFIDGGDADELFGGEGDDTLVGGFGDQLMGGAGNDIFVVRGGEGIRDFGTTDGDADFVDLTPYYSVLEEAQQDFATEGELTKVGSEAVQFDNIVATDFTTANTGLAANQAPIAVNDVFVVEEDVEPVDGFRLTLDILGNDSDPEGQTLTIKTVDAQDLSSSVLLGGFGSVELSSDGRSLIYTVDLESNGVDGTLFTEGFSYEIEDEFGAIAEGNASIRMNVLPLPEMDQ
ncbi:MAG: Ig-like domain-containing protein [Pseudomonadota bacterium]